MQISNENALRIKGNSMSSLYYILAPYTSSMYHDIELFGDVECVHAGLVEFELSCFKYMINGTLDKEYVW